MAQRFYDIVFAALTPPDAIEVIDYEAILEERKARFFEVWSMARVENPDLPDYDTLVLDTDPVAIVLQESAYREVMLRQLVNDRYMMAVLPYAFGTNLDVLGAHYSIVRQAGELDERFRRRIQLAHEAQAVAGPAGAYVFHALSAEPALTDVHVRIARPGHVELTCRVAGPDPRPTDDMLQNVLAYLVEGDRKPLTDMLTVRPPSLTRGRIVARLVVPPGPTRVPIMAEARKRLDATLASGLAGMDAPLYRSAIVAALHAPGVQAVELVEPTIDLIPAGPRAGVVVIDAITLTAVETI